MNEYADDMKKLASAMEAGDKDFLRDMHRKAMIELEIYKELPCNGRRFAPPIAVDRDRRCVSNCSTEFAATCHMRDHRACPRVLRDKMAHLHPSKADNAAELRRALVPAAIARMIGHAEEQPSRAIDVTRTWAESRKRLLVLSGGPRAGKTVAATWAIRHLAKSALFFNPSLLFQYGTDAGYLARAMACGLLIVDDIGTEMADETGKFSSRLDVLVCTRFDAGDRTILTTNLPAGEFSRRYGQRISARIQTGGTFAAIGVTAFEAVREPGEDDE